MMRIGKWLCIATLTTSEIKWKTVVVCHSQGSQRARGASSTSELLVRVTNQGNLVYTTTGGIFFSLAIISFLPIIEHFSLQ